MLPIEFENRMRAIMGDEFELLKGELENGCPERAFRINTAKIGVDDFDKINPFKTEKIPYMTDGYYFDEDKIGNHPYHHAGMIYVQDPSAMSVVNAIDVGEGIRALDMCSAPGGKSSQLAAKIGRDGVLVSNEYVSSRCKMMVGNFERLGLSNTIATNVDTATLAEWYDEYFDLVLIDAPCSGEGMFRKNSIAIDEWSVQNVQMCAERQREILDNGAKTLRAGGYLVYSTCTFALEENEMQIDAFLTRHPELSLVEAKREIAENTADGIVFDGAVHNDLDKCRRFYPHRTKGEGQFFAVMKKSGEGEGRVLYRDASSPLSRDEQSIVTKFLSDNLTEYADLTVRKYNDNIVAVSNGFPLPPNRVFCSGVMLGNISKGIFTPHHQLFSAYGDRFKRKINLTVTDKRLDDYLCGQVIPCDVEKNGYAAIVVDGVPLGGCKVVDKMAKNHYPKGLRLKK